MTTKDGMRSTALPERISGLARLSENLWWSWQPRAEDLYRDLDSALFESLEENPVLLLSAVAPERLRQAATDPDYLARYDEVTKRFNALLTTSPATTWVGEHQPELIERPVAYFSAEFGVHPSLPIYSGGLGVLAGDHAKAASDLGLPLVGVSLLYRQGYLRQRLTHDGWQLDVPGNLEHWTEPTNQVIDADGSRLYVEVEFEAGQPPVRLAVWRGSVGRGSV